jgi:hypothetical protein
MNSSDCFFSFFQVSMTFVFSSIVLLDNVVVELKVRMQLILSAMNVMTMEECRFANKKKICAGLLLFTFDVYR